VPEAGGYSPASEFVADKSRWLCAANMRVHKDSTVKTEAV
jgi:hypothetical protein